MADCIDQIILREGGLVNDPDDPGGLTKYGIAQRFHPDIDVASLTEPEARELLDDEYLKKSGIGQIPFLPLQCCLFDFAVNSGAATAVRALQLVLNVPRDGVVGPQTLEALAARDPKDVNNRVIAVRVSLLYEIVRQRPQQRKDLKGWLKRAKSFLLT